MDMSLKSACKTYFYMYVILYINGLTGYQIWYSACVWWKHWGNSQLSALQQIDLLFKLAKVQTCNTSFKGKPVQLDQAIDWRKIREYSQFSYI